MLRYQCMWTLMPYFGCSREQRCVNEAGVLCCAVLCCCVVWLTRGRDMKIADTEILLSAVRS